MLGFFHFQERQKLVFVSDLEMKKPQSGALLALLEQHPPPWITKRSEVIQKIPSAKS